MKLGIASLCLAVTMLVGFAPRPADACGGYFVQQAESSVVTDHRMALSISPQQTTLWDELSFSGQPQDFAWVLPIHGQVDVGLSSDKLFETLDLERPVAVYSPGIPCPQNQCDGSSTGSYISVGTGVVNVMANEVVGPYDTVQLKSADPQALNEWLTSHGYVIPPDVAPVIAAYVNEGFDFLAVRLMPGQGISTMRPVRVTSPGANATLPLRMATAGAGASTPVTLWVVGDGRYEPANVPVATLAAQDLVWNWDTQSSNYQTLRQAAFAASGGTGWLVESSTPVADLPQMIIGQVQADPLGSGYGDLMGFHSVDNAMLDTDALVAHLDPDKMMITRLSAQLSSAALKNDLSFALGPDQNQVPGLFEIGQTTGTAPVCSAVQQQSSCGTYQSLGADDGRGGGSGCAVSEVSSSDASTALALGLGVGTVGALEKRRRRTAGLAARARRAGESCRGTRSRKTNAP